MKKRNHVLSGVIVKQARLRKLLFDLKRKNEFGYALLIGRARERVLEQVDDLKDQLGHRQ